MSRASVCAAVVVAALVVVGALAPAAWAQRNGTLTSVTINPVTGSVDTPVIVIVNGTGKRPCTVTVSFGDGSAAAPMTGILPLQFTHAYSRPGQFTITAIAVLVPGPTAGCMGAVSATISVATAPSIGTVDSVTLNTGVAMVGAPLVVTVNGTRGPCTVTVSFGDGSAASSMTGIFPLQFTHVYSRPDQFTITATAVLVPGPTAGCAGAASATVTVVMAPSIGTVDSVTLNTGVAIVGTPVIVTVDGTRGPCPVTVSFGDGSVRSVTGNFPLQFTYAYARPGLFTITATSASVPGTTGPCSGTASTTVTAATTTTAPFSLRRVELRFENGRGTITVSKDRAPLRAFADVLYNGSGLLIVAWEVDGRTLAIQQEFVTFGARKVIPTPDVPSLPTFEPGLHRLTFRVIQPAASFTIPEVTYYVEAGPNLSRIELVSPAEGAVVANSPVLFQWRSPIPAAAYRLEIFQEGKPPVFAAVTRDQSFRLPAPYERLLTAGARYAWHVKALSEDALEIGESGAWGYLWQPAPGASP